MSDQISLDKLQQNLDFFHKMYDVVRLVDPVQKRVLECRGNRMGETSTVCHEYWKSGRICENCISVRAYLDNKSYVKLEQNSDVIMLVTAVPVETFERPAVLELLKNATDSLMIGAGDYNKGQAMRDAVCEVNDMVVKDSLTSVYNRRFMDDRLPADIVQAALARQPLSAVFIDIDGMKTINDTYGHAAGDLALKYVADVIQNCIRVNMDWTARYGGDEFFLCLNNTGENDARRIAERIHGCIAAIQIPVENGSINVAASLGIKTMSGPTLTADEIIRMADENMYEAKRNGSNRSVKRVVAFGGLEVYGDFAKQVVRWPTEKVRELFACFVADSGRELEKWQLCERLWPQSPPKKAEHSLHSAISRMKSSLREAGIPNTLRCEKGMYRLDLSGFFCDAWELETFLESNPTVNEKNITSFERILALYQGDLFGGRDYAWCLVSREKLRSLAVAGMKDVGRYFLEKKDYERAEEFLQRSIRLDPFDEEAVELLLKAYFSTGNQEKFVRCFANLKLVLKEELGVGPRVETIRLYTDLLHKL